MVLEAEHQPRSKLRKRLVFVHHAQVGEWREQPAGYLAMVNPQTQELLDKIYSQVLTRVYVNASGHCIMLSLAYGSDQRRSLQVHKPEVCYPAQGFTVQKNEAVQLGTAFGTIPARRLFAMLQARQEPLAYWFTVGDTARAESDAKEIGRLALRPDRAHSGRHAVSSVLD